MHNQLETSNNQLETSNILGFYPDGLCHVNERFVSDTTWTRLHMAKDTFYHSWHDFHMFSYTDATLQVLSHPQDTIEQLKE